jgi:hypothetical protein
MLGARINLPDNIIRISRPRSSRKLLTTKDNEERIYLAKEDRSTKLENRYLRREDSTYNCQELESTEGLVRLRGLLLRKLALQENTLKGLSEGSYTGICKREDHGDIEGKLQRIKYETVEALTTLA